MTGAIPLEGQVLLVVGVHDKVLAAHRRGLDRVLPRRNAKEIHEELGDDVRRVTAVQFVSHLDELLDLALRLEPTAGGVPVVEPHASATARCLRSSSGSMYRASRVLAPRQNIRRRCATTSAPTAITTRSWHSFTHTGR